MFKTGIVVEINEVLARVRVRFDDLDDVVSYLLPVLKAKTHLDKCYSMPDLNEHVVCLLDENGEEGVVLGAIYSEADIPPVTDSDKHHVTYQDGTVIEYDRSTHKLIAHVAGDIDLTATGTIAISAPEVNITGAVGVTGGIDATGSIIDGGANTNHHSH